MTDPNGPARKPGKFFFFFGVVLPLLALIFETTTHYCAQHFFDPFPSTAHILLFLLIPLTNFMTWLASRRDLSPFYLFIALGNGMALGIGCLYTLMFLPISGTACLGILFLGFGLLAFSPLLSLPCSWLAGKSVCSLASNRSTFFDAHQMEHIGHLVVLIMVVAIELPSTLTRVYLGEAVDADGAKSQPAISWLRKYGSQEVMLRACYERSGRATDILGSLAEHVHPVSMEQARTIFYKVTGKPFNSVPIPASARATIKNTSLVDDPADLNAGVQDEFDYDADIAGETVSGTARGLSVSSSKLSGNVDSDALLAVMDWTFAFENSSTYDREARCKILLPPGAVATKAVMTVDGVAHEAEIQGRQEARQIYTEAVKARKNPLLVSVCGQDQLLVQCYPIRHGSDIKVSLKMVAPATLGENASQATLVLPSFSEKNFQADVPLELEGLSSGERSSALTAINKTGADQELSRFDAVLHLQRDPNCKSVYCNDSWTDMNSVIKRVIRPEQHQMPRQLIVVIDGSLQMKGRLADVVAGLKALPSTVPTEVVLVSDKDQFLCKAGTKPADASFEKALQTLSEYQPVGGQDDSIVVRAMARGKAKPGTQVLWIHGAQPAASEFGSGGVKYFLAQAGVQPALYDLQVAPGPNEYLAFSDSYPSLISVAPTGSISGDMKRLFSTWTSKPDTSAPEYIYSGVRVEGDTAKHTLPELAQLWAYDNVLRHASSPNLAQQHDAVAMSLQYHLITPASSAIVVDEIPQLAGEIAAPAPIVDRWLAQLNLQGFVKQSFDKITGDLNRLNVAARQERPKVQVTDIEFSAPAPTGGGGLVGAPVDPRYGQSNEVGMLEGRGDESSVTTGGATADTGVSDGLLGWSGSHSASNANKPMAGTPTAAPTPLPSSVPPRIAGGGGAGYGGGYGGGGTIMSQQEDSPFLGGGDPSNSSNYSPNLSSNNTVSMPNFQAAPELQGATNGTVGPVIRDQRQSDASSVLLKQKSASLEPLAASNDKLQAKKEEAERAYKGHREMKVTQGDYKYDRLSQSSSNEFAKDDFGGNTASSSFRMESQSVFFNQLMMAGIFWIAMLIGFGFAANLILVLIRNARKNPVPG